MENQVEDQPVLNHIQHLVVEEHRLREQRAHHRIIHRRMLPSLFMPPTPLSRPSTPSVIPNR
jgi:hypothetical protein